MPEARDTLAIVHRSGFPLQMHVQELIRSKAGGHPWYLFAHEHPWKNEAGRRGFVDLIAGRGSSLGIGSGERPCRLTLVIECKRFSKTTWLFLAAPPANEGKVAQLLHARDGEESRLTRRGFGQPMAESEYCVLETEGKSDRRQLESMGGELLESLEAISNADRDDFKNATYPYGSALYVPVLVTTAALRLCIFEPTAASLEDGRVPNDRVTERPIPWVRFNKDLGFFNGERSLKAVQFGSIPPHQTVFVVSAKNFTDFLVESSGA